MRRIILLLLALSAAGCVTARDNQAVKPNPAAYHYQMGLGYLGERNYTGALVELTEAEKHDPDNPELLYNLGLAYRGKKRPDLAEQRFQRALMLKPSYTAARNDLGVAYLDLKRWDSAIQQFQIVKDDLFYENGENASVNLGLAYLGAGDYPRAVAELKGVLSANPRKLEARLSLGRVYFAMEKTEQAIIEYRKALDLYKDYGDAHFHLGLARMKMNDLDAARASFKEVVRIKPDSENGRSALEYLDLLK